MAGTPGRGHPHWLQSHHQVVHQAEARILSVVIPTLNEAKRLPRLLGGLDALTLLHEVIVADGGSTDGTPDLAAARGCRVVFASRGRGSQLRAGVAAARGEWLLMLHADALISPAAFAEATTALDDPEFQFGVWPLRIDAAGKWMRLVELGAALRWRLFGLAYGDQGLLVSRVLYESVGGYPDSPIMEDVTLSRALHRRAGGCRFRSPVTADARRYLSEGGVRRALTNLVLVTLFYLGFSPRTLARWYRPQTHPV